MKRASKFRESVNSGGDDCFSATNICTPSLIPLKKYAREHNICTTQAIVLSIEYFVETHPWFKLEGATDSELDRMMASKMTRDEKIAYLKERN